MIFTRHTIPNAIKAAARAIRTFFSKDPVIASAGVQSIRELRCSACPHLVGDQCSLCSCFVSVKTSLASEACPDGRWSKETRFSKGLIPKRSVDIHTGVSRN